VTLARSISQKTEIASLRVQVEALQALLAQAGEAAKAAEERSDIAVRVLSEKGRPLASTVDRGGI
jgi:hypothetical protein